MDVKDRFKSLPQTVRTKGTRFYKIRNYVSWTVISVGLAIGYGYSCLPQWKRFMAKVEEGYFDFFDDKTEKAKLTFLPSSFSARTAIHDIEDWLDWNEQKKQQK